MKQCLALRSFAINAGDMLQFLGLNILYMFRNMPVPNYLPSPLENSRIICTAPLDVKDDVSPDKAKFNWLVVVLIPVCAPGVIPLVFCNVCEIAVRDIFVSLVILVTAICVTLILALYRPLSVPTPVELPTL